MKWFKHLTKAHHDRAIETLINEYGVKGYGLYFYCLELVAGTLDAENITFELEPDAAILSRRLSMDTLEVEKIMKRCIELNLFEIAKSGRLTCLKLGKYLESGQTNNPEIRKIITGYRGVKTQKSEIICDESHHIRLDKTRLDKTIKPDKPTKPTKPTKPINTIETDTNFITLYNAYPRHIGKVPAYKAYTARIKEGVSHDTLLIAVKNYAADVERNRTDEKYIMHPATFLGPSARYADYSGKKEVNQKPELFCPECAAVISKNSFCWNCARTMKGLMIKPKIEELKEG